MWQSDFNMGSQGHRYSKILAMGVISLLFICLSEILFYKFMDGCRYLNGCQHGFSNQKTYGYKEESFCNKRDRHQQEVGLLQAGIGVELPTAWD